MSDRLGELEMLSRCRDLTDDEIAEMVRIIANERRATWRRHLYQTDPLYRLSKAKDNRERRARKRMAS